jgi:hypothetical protein
MMISFVIINLIISTFAMSQYDDSDNSDECDCMLACMVAIYDFVETICPDTIHSTLCYVLCNALDVKTCCDDMPTPVPISGPYETQPKQLEVDVTDPEFDVKKKRVNNIGISNHKARSSRKSRRNNNRKSIQNR